jgi:hypothetical protein
MSEPLLRFRKLSKLYKHKIRAFVAHKLAKTQCSLNHLIGQPTYHISLQHHITDLSMSSKQTLPSVELSVYIDFKPCIPTGTISNKL